VRWQYGVDLRTAALRFSAAPDVAAALIVGARSEEQVLANVTSRRPGRANSAPASYMKLGERPVRKLLQRSRPPLTARSE
jgi:hypothetical protein